jgi:hypothetical protein
VALIQQAGGSLRTPVAPPQVEHLKSSGISLRIFVLVLLLLVAGAIVRSAIATRLDGFTIDEAYNIVAGVSYVRHEDFASIPSILRWSSCGWELYIRNGPSPEQHSSIR